MNCSKNRIFEGFICFQIELQNFWRYEQAKNKIKICQLLYIVKKTKSKNFAQKLKTIYQTEITKQSHTVKTYAQTYIIEIFYSFNPELVLKNTKCAIVKTRLKNLLSELKGLKFWKLLSKNLKNWEWWNEVKNFLIKLKYWNNHERLKYR